MLSFFELIRVYCAVFLSTLLISISVRFLPPTSCHFATSYRNEFALSKVYSTVQP